MVCILLPYLSYLTELGAEAFQGGVCNTVAGETRRVREVAHPVRVNTAQLAELSGRDDA